MRIGVPLLLLLAWGCSAVSAERRVLSPDDFYNLQIVSDAQVAPDGKWVAYLVSQNDREADEGRGSIWMVSWDGRERVQLTNPAHEIGPPRWSPDGRYLAYTSVPPGGDKSQILLLDRRGGEPKALTTVTDDIQSFEWSPDGKRLIVVIDQGPPKAKDAKLPEPQTPIVIDGLFFKEDKVGYLDSVHKRHLFLLDVASRKLDPLTSDPKFNEDLAVWSPDSQHIAFVRTHEKTSEPDGTAQIDVMDAKSGAVATGLTRVNVPNQQKLAWSPDGKLIAFLQGTTEVKYAQYQQDRLAVVKATGGPMELLTDSLDRGITFYVFDKTGASIIATIEDDTTSYPISVDVRSHAIKKFPQGLATASDPATANGHTVLLAANDGTANEVFAFESGRLRKLTNHNDALLASLQLGAVEDIHCTSADGTPIHGLLVKPPHYNPGQRYPTVLWIHGGPNLQDEHSMAFDGYQFKRQLLAAQGFAVLGINYRGGSGRGSDFSRAIFADWGHKEVADVLAGVAEVVRQGVADPDKLGIGGWSYGGMLTDYTIASDTRFKAAISGAGTANPLGMYATDQYYIQYSKELGDPWRNPDLYIRLAYPLLHADRIHTPTMFMGGAKDFNVPVVGGEQMYLALRSLDVPAQLVVYPGEYHTLTRPSFLKDRAERMAAWYSQDLLSSPPNSPR